MAQKDELKELSLERISEILDKHSTAYDMSERVIHLLYENKDTFIYLDKGIYTVLMSTKPRFSEDEAKRLQEKAYQERLVKLKIKEKVSMLSEDEQENPFYLSAEFHHFIRLGLSDEQLEVLVSLSLVSSAQRIDALIDEA
ncbi:MAG: hypothetical protein Q4E22_03995 [Coriobacteriia bacterium]|nr:hypothetical protein [Coriobacteriia bacterium]